MVDTTNPILKDCTNDNSKLKTWVKSITDDPQKQRTILSACYFAKKVHKSDLHDSGEPFLTHLIKVTDILAQLGMNTDVLIAGILHDIVEKQPELIDKIERDFGKKVRHLVDGVAKMRVIEEINDKKHKDNTKVDTERLRNMLLAMAEDVRVILIKLADRVDNMRALRNQPVEKQRRMARETLDLFAPLANRLGMWQIKWELEDWSLRYLDPEIYKKLAHYLDERRVDREKYIKQVKDQLSSALNNAGIEAEVSGRPKHIYSIWRKMQNKELDFEKVFDVRAVRVIVNTIPECYDTLGLVHEQWQPLPSEFDDYINNPKPNNYQSLHTAVIGPDQKIFEVQIRTHQMHHHAEFGIASHWRYKEGNTEYNQNFEKKLAELRKFLEQCNDDDGDANDFLERFKSNFFEENVYVLSPQGKVIELPKGSKPLDFAYALHTKLGHCCYGATVNNKRVPLSYTLKSGDVVDILTNREENPSRHWLIQADYLKTTKARNSVRYWLKKQNNQQHILEGRQSLESLLRRLNINCKFEDLTEKLNINSVNELLAAIGRGDVSIEAIAETFKQQILMPYVDIEIIANDKIGLLKEIYDVIFQDNINVLASHTESDMSNNRANIKYKLEVNDITQLSCVLLKIESLDSVVKVWRK
jgi:GTP pyrophosphokinase